jgi:two-component system response regulator VicR
MNASPAHGVARRVLVVEDDQAMSVALRDGLTYEGYEVLLATNGPDGLRLARQCRPEAMLLDVMLPGISGLDICKRLRSEGCAVPIIMLTARGQEIDKVLGLRLGADDYVTKPFSFLELLARLEAVMRRTQRAVAEPTNGRDCFSFGAVSVDFAHHEASRGGVTVELTPREFRLLGFFVQHRGEVVTRDQLLAAVWGYSAIPFTRTVDVHIAKLRKKLEDNPEDPRYILTVHGMGYKFAG